MYAEIKMITMTEQLIIDVIQFCVPIYSSSFSVRIDSYLTSTKIMSSQCKLINCTCTRCLAACIGQVDLDCCVMEQRCDDRMIHSIIVTSHQCLWFHEPDPSPGHL